MGRLHKELGLGYGTGMMATSLLGSGIFVVPAVAAGLAGADSLWAWLLLMVLVLPVAFTFARLGRAFPHAGGAPHLIGRALGLPMEKLAAFLFLAVLPVGLPAMLTLTTGFWHALFPLNDAGDLLIQLGSLGLVLLLGSRPGGASGLVQLMIAITIVGLLVAVWLAGGLAASAAATLPAPSTVSWGTLPAVLAVMFWCFVGLEAFTHMGEEFRRPERDFPLALLLGVLLAGLVYFAYAMAVVKFGLYGDERTNTTSFPVLLAMLFGEPGRWVAALVGYAACFAGLNLYVQGFGRLLWSLADEGKLPASLGRLNRHGAPFRALCWVVAACTLCVLAAWLFRLPLETLMRYANGNFVLVYLLAMIAGVRLLTGFWRALALVATLLCAGVFVSLGLEAGYALVLGAGFIGARAIGARRARPQLAAKRQRL
ncbi:L-methionine/branched-chain amino acid transporter [Oceanimonas doudoroffii]|uniref:Inner membrane protein YjeH n=1 Tax=Oceanimonas doudoroffii TaxID=84158 RepID=G5CZG7_9GAMM|nr:L-methionine/branched-chain amino acid transporter [Oceanimonas doudoroffii]AEQ39122.1 inner membrane protein YjeH [Oceanimonas doudoroffii]OXY83461.1 L-methionine/branched-chain amino acid transporter [Oceanimonas doudoroffii]